MSPQTRIREYVRGIPEANPTIMKIIITRRSEANLFLDTSPILLGHNPISSKPKRFNLTAHVKSNNMLKSYIKRIFILNFNNYYIIIEIYNILKLKQLKPKI